jgi:hypothetical protein
VSFYAQNRIFVKNVLKRDKRAKNTLLFNGEIELQVKIKYVRAPGKARRGQHFFKISFNDEIKLPTKITLEFIIYRCVILNVIFWKNRDKT